jgi:hypothetical protein
LARLPACPGSAVRSASRASAVNHPDIQHLDALDQPDPMVCQRERQLQHPESDQHQGGQLSDLAEVATLWDLAEQAAEQQHARHGRDETDDAGHGMHLAELGEEADDVSVWAARHIDGGQAAHRVPAVTRHAEW